MINISCFILLHCALWLNAACSLPVTKCQGFIISIAGGIWGYSVDCTRIQILPFHRQENSYFLKSPRVPTVHQPGQERLWNLVNMLWPGAIRHWACSSALLQDLSGVASSLVDRSCWLTHTAKNPGRKSILSLRSKQLGFVCPDTPEWQV